MELNNQTFCFFGKNSTVTGDIILSGPSHISCKVIGDIQILDNNLLSIEPAGEIEGCVKGNDIEVYGKIKGDIIAEGMLVIYPTAKVDGKISAKNLVIKPGATVNMIGHTTL